MAQTMEPNPVSQAPRVVGFLCDWAVKSEGLVNEDGTMVDLPNVTLILVPCSGFVKTGWLDMTLKSGAAGVFVCGCPMGDCLNREGNWIMEERIDQLRKRLQRQKVDPERIGFVAYGMHDRDEFVADVRAFVDKVAALGAAPRAGGKR